MNAKASGEGVTLEKFEELTMEDGRTGVKATYAFKDINKLKFRPFGPHKTPSERCFTFSKTGHILTVQSPPNQPEKASASASKKPKFTKEQWKAQSAMTRPFFVQMKHRFQIKFTDGIASSDADHIANDTVTMVDKMIEFVNKDDDLKPEELIAAFRGVKGLKAQEKKKLTFHLK